MFRSIVDIYNGACCVLAKYKDENTIVFLGSCFIAHQDGLLITCSHLVSPLDKLCILPPMDANSFTPITMEGKVKTINVELCAMDTDVDMAILRMSDFKEITIPDGVLLSTSPKTGSSCMYIGYPYGDVGLHNPKYSSSTLSGKVIINNVNHYIIDSLAHEGNSGGPLIDYHTRSIYGVINGHFNPSSNGPFIQVGSRVLGSDSTITKAVSIEYATPLINEVLSKNGK